MSRTRISKAILSSQQMEPVRTLRQHSFILEQTAELTRRIIARLLTDNYSPDAIDYKKRGNYVRPNIVRSILLRRLTISHLDLNTIGQTLLDNRFVVGKIHVPLKSDYSHEYFDSLFRREAIGDIPNFVWTPYRFLQGHIDPKNVSGENPAPAFELSEELALAAESQLVLAAVDNSQHPFSFADYVATKLLPRIEDCIRAKTQITEAIAP